MAKMITIQNKNQQDAALLRWVKNFANTNYHQVNFLPENVLEVAYRDLEVQLSSDADAEQLLDSLGIISAIVKSHHTCFLQVLNHGSL